MDAGAIGFASQRSPTHNGDGGRPVPSRVADLDELRTLLGPVRDAGRGVVALLPGGVFSNDEVFDLQAEIGRPFTWTALLTIKGFPYHEKVIEEHDAARARGVEVWPQVSCRPLVFQMNLAEPFTLNMRTSFQALMDVPRDERIAAYRDPRGARRRGTSCRASRRARCRSTGRRCRSPSRARHPELVDRKVLDIAAERGVHAARRPARPLARGRPRRPASGRCSPTTTPTPSPGCSPATACCSAWPTRAPTSASSATPASPPTCSATGCATARSCRSSGPSTSSPASRPRCTASTTAARIEVGKAADIAVFDADTVAPGPLRRVRDFPADGERLTADAAGRHDAHVLVNGVPIRVDGEMVPDALASRPGRMIS